MHAIRLHSLQQRLSTPICTRLALMLKSHGLKAMLMVTLISTAALAHGEQFTLSLQRDSISIHDHLSVTFELRSSSSGAATRSNQIHYQEPDFSPLQGDFEILANHRGQQTQIINNQASHVQQWRLTLAPKATGKLTIPSITLGNLSTDPATVTVSETIHTPDGAGADTFIEVSVNKDTAFVQEQILISVKLYSKVQWRSKNILRFDLPNALIEAVDENEYVSTIDGIPHLVYEVTLAAYPQRSGNLTFPALTYEIEPRTQRRSLFSELHGSGTRLRGQSEPIELTIRPMPADSQGTWLPANAISLTEHWSHNPNALVAGEPVTRRITLTADGLTTTQLPPIDMEVVPGINVYRDQAQTEQQPSRRGNVSERTETIAMVPAHAGEFTLPEVEVRWWNTREQRFDTAFLPARTLTVTAPAGSARSPSATPQEPGISNPQVIYSHTAPRWLMVSQAITAALLLVFMALYWRASRQSKPAPVNNREADGHVWKQLKNASAQNDLNRLRKLLLIWFSEHWGKPCQSLNAIAAHCETEYADQALAQDLRALDKALFQTPPAAFDSGALLQKIQALRVANRERKNNQALPPLYPST